MSHSEPFVIKPTFISVDQELLRRLHTVCEVAIENASECLNSHDSSLGRATRKSKRLAEFHEQGIRDAKQALSEVKKALGWPALNAEPSEVIVAQQQTLGKTITCAHCGRTKHVGDACVCDPVWLFKDFENWLTQECEKNNRLLSLHHAGEADLRRDEELVHTLTTLRRYKQQTSQ